MRDCGLLQVWWGRKARQNWFWLSWWADDVGQTEAEMKECILCSPGRQEGAVTRLLSNRVTWKRRELRADATWRKRRCLPSRWVPSALDEALHTIFPLWQRPLCHHFRDGLLSRDHFWVNYASRWKKSKLITIRVPLQLSSSSSPISLWDLEVLSSHGSMSHVRQRHSQWFIWVRGHSQPRGLVSTALEHYTSRPNLSCLQTRSACQCI